MNRQQRRAQPQRTKYQWLMQLTELSKTSPGVPDDTYIAQLLLDVIAAEQRNLSEMSLAVLCGLAAAHLARVKADLPKAQHVNAQGEPVYTEADVAKELGIPIEQAHQLIAEAVREHGADIGISRASDELNPLH